MKSEMKRLIRREYVAVLAVCAVYYFLLSYLGMGQGSAVSITFILSGIIIAIFSAITAIVAVFAIIATAPFSEPTVLASNFDFAALGFGTMFVVASAVFVAGDYHLKYWHVVLSLLAEGLAIYLGIKIGSPLVLIPVVALGLLIFFLLRKKDRPQSTSGQEGEVSTA